MPNPVPFPPVPLPLSELDSLHVEAFVAAFAQVVAAGSIGSLVKTPPSLLHPSNSPPGTVVPMMLDSLSKQLMFRQIAAALVNTLAKDDSSFTAACPVDLVPGDLVAASPGIPNTVQRAHADDTLGLPGIGCIIFKPTTLTCVVKTQGVIPGIYVGLVPGAKYFLGPLGGVVPAQPVPPFGVTYTIQPIGVALDLVTMLLMPSLATTRQFG